MRFFIYFVFFGAAFLYFPLHGSLPGNTDTVLSISLSNLIVEKMKLILSGAPTWTALYPAPNIMAFGENCYGLVGLFLFFRTITQSDIWGYYGFIVCIFALNSFAISRLAGLYLKREVLAIIAGFLFSLAGFVFANIDDPNIIFVFFPVMGLYYVLKNREKSDQGALRIGLILSGLQIWFGFYIFLFQIIVLGIVFLNHPKCMKLKDLGYFIIPASPLLVVYLYNHFYGDVISPYNAEATTLHASIGWYNLLNVLPNNLLYSSAHNQPGPYNISAWHQIRKCCFLGVLLPASAALGAWFNYKRSKVLLIMMISFFIFSFWANLPFYHWIEKLPLAQYFRVPVRFYLFSLIPLVVYAMLGWEWILERYFANRKTWAIAILASATLLVVLENVPFPPLSFPLGDLLRLPKEYETFAQQFSNPQILLDLPSTVYYLPGGRGAEYELVWFYNREMIYMNWQTQHHQIINGGVNGYVSKIRAAADPAIQRIPDWDALQSLKALGTQYLVFHKNLVLNPVENNLEALQKSPHLKNVFEKGEIAVFEILWN